MKKKGGKFSYIFTVVFVIIIILIIVGMTKVLHMSNELREFKVDMFVLCNESSICVSDGDDGTVKIADANLPALYALMQSTKGYFTLDDPESVDLVNFDFECHDEEWNLLIEDCSNNKLRVTLTGPRNYKLYIKNQKKFPEFKKVASEKGYTAKNKIIGKK